MTGHVQIPITDTASPLRPGVWWVDETGDVHSGVGVDQSFDSLFFRHLGHIKLAVNFPRITISWDVHNVSGDALTTVIDRLTSYTSDLAVHLKFFYYGWIDEHFPDQRAAVERIQEISRFQSVELIRSTYIEEHDISTVSDATDLISNGYRLWERASGDLKRTDQEELCGYLPHVLIFRRSQNDQNLVFSHIGTKSVAAQVYGAQWVTSAFNEKSDASLEPSNLKYDLKVSEAYNRILETEEPRYDHVRALLHLGNHLEPFWVSYERLLTYSLLHDGSPAVVCLVNRTQNVSIPLAGDS